MIERTRPDWDAIREASRRPAGYLYTRFVNRPAGRYVAWAAGRLGMTPNAVSVASAGLTIVAAALALRAGEESAGRALMAYFFFAFGHVLDSADGQLARATGVKSKAGMFLDHSLDGLKMPLAMAAIGYTYLGFSIEPLVWGGRVWPGVALVAVASWGFSVTWQKDAVIGSREKWIRPSLGMQYLLRTPFDFGVVLMWLPALVLFPAFATVGFQIFVPAYAVFVLLLFLKGYREIRDLPVREP